MKKFPVRYKDCLNARSSLVKEAVGKLEELAIKYNVTPDDFHEIRTLIRKQSFILSNTWHYFLANAVDNEKFKDKAYPDGETADGDTEAS